jgi:hypothetical protein
LLQTAVAAIDYELDNDWAYTETYVVSGQTIIARYDPRRRVGARWEVRSVDGRAPTDDEIAQFLDHRGEDDSGDDSGSEFDRSEDISELIAPESLMLIEETDDYWLFTFVPGKDVDDDWDLSKYLDATLRISKRGPYVEEVKLESSDPFRPRFGVRVREFLTLLRFGPASDGGPIVPLNVKVRLIARAFLAFGINESIEASRTDYEYVAD